MSKQPPFDAVDFLHAVVTQNREKLRAFFMPSAIVRWPNTREVFSVEDYLRANCEYPGTWQGELVQVRRLGDLVITVAHIWQHQPPVSVHACSFIELERGRIVRMTEYWSEDGEPPDWRKAMRLGQFK